MKLKLMIAVKQLVLEGKYSTRALGIKENEKAIKAKMLTNYLLFV